MLFGVRKTCLGTFWPAPVCKHKGSALATYLEYETENTVLRKLLDKMKDFIHIGK